MFNVKLKRTVTYAAVMAALTAPLAAFGQGAGSGAPAGAPADSDWPPQMMQRNNEPADAPPAPPGTSETLTTLRKVVEYTLVNNPHIQSTYHDFRSFFEGQNVAKGAMLPQVNANGWIGKEWRNHIHDNPSYDPRAGGGAAKSWGRPGYNLELRQLLFDGFATYNTYRQAGFEKLSKFFDMMATADSVSYEAVQAYIDVTRYRNLETLASDNFKMHQETLEQIRQRADSGVGRRVDLEQASGRLALAQTNLMTETANLIDVQSRFARIVTVQAPKNLEPAPDPTPNMPVEKNLKNFDESLRVNPSILSKQALIQAYEKGVLAAKGQFSPRFDFVAMTGTDRELPSRQYRDLQASSISIQGHWNLYRGNSDVSRVRQVTAQQYAQRDLRDYTCRNVQQDMATSWNSMANLRAQLPYLRDHAVATAKVREAYRQQFQIGQRTLLDLLDTENERFQAARALANAEYDLQLAQYRWLSLAHRLLPTLLLAQLDTSKQLPDEAAELELTEEVIKLCSSVVPDTSALKPIAITYGVDDKPPTITPSKAAPRRPAANKSSQSPQSPRPAKW